MRLWVLILLLHPSSGFGYSDWEPQYSHYQLEYGDDETFTVLIIEPVNVRKLLAATPRHRRKRMQTRLLNNRWATAYLLDMAHEYILEVYREREVFPDSTREALVEGLAALKQGMSPLVLITDFHDPYVIFQTVSFGMDWGDGIPSEQRMVGRGMLPLIRPKLQLSPQPITFIPTEGELFDCPQISEILSRAPRCHGSIIEAKTFSKARYSKYDFRPLISRLLISHRLHLWSRIPVPEELRPPPISANDLRLLRHAQKRYPGLDDDLLHPERQEYVLNDRVSLRAHRPALTKVYRWRYGFEPPSQVFPDPDVPNTLSFIQHSNRVTFEQAGLRHHESEHYPEVLTQGRVVKDPFHPLICSSLMTQATARRVESGRPRALRPSIRLLRHPDGFSPENSLLEADLTEVFRH